MDYVHEWLLSGTQMTTASTGQSPCLSPSAHRHVMPSVTSRPTGSGGGGGGRPVRLKHIQQTKPLTLGRAITLYPLTNYTLGTKEPPGEGQLCGSQISRRGGGI